jgi:hypothetical protein
VTIVTNSPCAGIVSRKLPVKVSISISMIDSPILKGRTFAVHHVRGYFLFNAAYSYEGPLLCNYNSAVHRDNHERNIAE